MWARFADEIQGPDQCCLVIRVWLVEHFDSSILASKQVKYRFWYAGLHGVCDVQLESGNKDMSCD
jgi:hypothetical protein